MDVIKTVTVYPEEGNFPMVAKGLLEVAEHPGQVIYVSWPKAGFMVPEEIFERFEAMNKATQEGGEDKPAKRGPGRPRKNAESVNQEPAGEGNNA